jgi:hypothetical protein
MLYQNEFYYAVVISTILHIISYHTVEVDPTTTSAKCNRILHQPGSPAVGLNLKDTDNLSP